jgi:hypothetical protein
MVIPKGDILEIRLFDSGRFEYDDYPRCDSSESYAGEVTVVRRESKTDKDAVLELIRLAQQPDFQSAKETFSRPANSGRIDTSTLTTITFNYDGKKKSISAKDFNDIEYIEKRRLDYPTSMVKLYQKVLELKSEIFARSKAGCKQVDESKI